MWYECLWLDTSAIQESAKMIYLSLNCSIAVLAYGVFITNQYEIQNIFNKAVFDNTTFTIGIFSKKLLMA